MELYVYALSPLIFQSLTNQAMLKNHFHYQLIFCIYIVTIRNLYTTDLLFTFAVKCFIFSGWVGEKHIHFITSFSEIELLKDCIAQVMWIANVYS
jgi:hypothetical protein